MHHITRCLNSKLIDICQRAIKLEELSTVVFTYLPDILRNQCKVGSFNNGCLNLITNDPVWASQLRYALPELRDKLRLDAGIYQLASIKITVCTETKLSAQPKTLKTLTLSAKARENISAGAKQCSYGPLKEALQHLIDA